MTSTSGPPEDLWIETRRGGIFFVNALLIFPQVMLFVPLLTRILVRNRGGLPRESQILDTFPAMAEHLLPQMGWLLLVPIGLVVYNLRLEDAFWPRVGLWVFLTLHVSLLAWTVGVWFGRIAPVLPGGA